MSTLVVILALAVGVAAALGTGALSGLRIGKDALGTELAAYMGALYGGLAGGAAVVVTTLFLLLI